jgi:uridine kinase
MSKANPCMFSFLKYFLRRITSFHMDSTSTKEASSLECFGEQLAHDIETKDIDSISIDGQRCAGKTTFAKDVSDLLTQADIPNEVVAVDDFLLPRTERAGKKDPNDWYDYEKFKTVFPDFVNKKSFCFEHYNHSNGKVDKQKEIWGHPNKVLIFEGLFAAKFAEVIGFKPSLRILLWVRENKALERIIQRDGFFDAQKHTELMNTIYFPAVREYEQFLENYDFTQKINTTDFNNITTLDNVS